MISECAASGDIDKSEDRRGSVIPVDSADEEDRSGDQDRMLPKSGHVSKSTRCCLKSGCNQINKLWLLVVDNCSALLLTAVLVNYALGDAVSLSCIWISIFGAFLYFQDLLLYYPDVPLFMRAFSPSPVCFNQPELVEFVSTLDGKARLHCYLVRNPVTTGVATRGIIIFFHGNAGNVGYRLPNAIEMASQLCCDVFMVEYRGYGLSTGRPSEEGLYNDSQSVMEYVFSNEHLNSRRIYVFGRSLGGAVAIDVASNPDYKGRISGLFVENTFTSIPEVAGTKFGLPYLGSLPCFCYKNKFYSDSKIATVTCPVLFLSGLADTLLSPVMVLKLYNMCGSGRKRLVRFQTGSHVATMQCAGYYHCFSGFITEIINDPRREEESIFDVNRRGEITSDLA